MPASEVTFYSWIDTVITLLITCINKTVKVIFWKHLKPIICFQLVIQSFNAHPLIWWVTLPARPASAMCCPALLEKKKRKVLLRLFPTETRTHLDIVLLQSSFTVSFTKACVDHSECSCYSPSCSRQTSLHITSYCCQRFANDSLSFSLLWVVFALSGLDQSQELPGLCHLCRYCGIKLNSFNLKKCIIDQSFIKQQ